jgi:hypothetical protein
VARTSVAYANAIGGSSHLRCLLSFGGVAELALPSAGGFPFLVLGFSFNRYMNANEVINYM